MEFAVKSGSPEKQRSACVVAGVFEPRRLSPAAKRLDAATGGLLASLCRRGDMEGRLGQTLLLPNVPEVPADRLLLVGCGRERELDAPAWRRMVTAMLQALEQCGATEAVSYLSELTVRGEDPTWQLCQGVLLAHEQAYRFERLRSRPDPERRPLRRLVQSVPTRRWLPRAQAAIRVAAATGAGMDLARDLGNLPGNLCTPNRLAAEAEDLAARHGSLEVEVLGPEAMAAEGMQALLAVARGSAEPPRLIVLRYRGGGDEAAHVLVGKGVTFDSGGLSLKPAEAMDEMKFDMGGAAAVLGTLEAVARLQLPVNVAGVIAAVENMPDGNALRPGDVLTTMAGRTVEVLNTDAEGRLILADALTYARRLQPASLVDLATLTGACVVALGHHAHAVLGNTPGLVNELLAAGRRSGDRAWELPLWPEYRDALKSRVADLANVGGRAAGAITAASFLSHFSEGLRWAHLDIAGTAWRGGEQKGATGRPVPLLVQYLVDRCPESP